MPEQSVRFCVVDKVNRIRAATWKVWSPNGKDDVYVGCRELKGAMKLSLHQSGQWHLAYDGGFYDKNVPKDKVSHPDRFIHKWEKPDDIGTGIALALRIVTPSTSIGTEFSHTNKLTTIDPPKDGRSVEVAIFISEPSTLVSNWPAKNSMNSELIGTYELPNRKRVWVVFWECETPDFSGLPKEFKFFNGVTKADIANSVRAVVFGDHADGSKVLYDLRGQKV